MDRQPLTRTLIACLARKIRPPVGIVLGSPGEVVEIVEALGGVEVVCFQMDLHPARRIQDELHARGLAAEMAVLPDLWDLPRPMSTLVYPAPKGGERNLKIDMIEQAFHALAAGGPDGRSPRGVLIVLSPYDREQFFPVALKKVFGRVHVPMEGGNALFWCQRDGDRARRRHEVTFQVRFRGERSLSFVSRPGVFSYGRLDDGARALVEAARVEPGQRVLDLGCGVGTNGVLTALEHGSSFTGFLDSNVRAAVLAEVNARAAGIGPFEVKAATVGEGFAPGSFDAVLANPPYFAQSSIAERFVACGRDYLKPGGSLFIVTKQVQQVAEMMERTFGDVDGEERRGYVVFQGRRG